MSESKTPTPDRLYESVESPEPDVPDDSIAIPAIPYIPSPSLLHLPHLPHRDAVISPEPSSVSARALDGAMSSDNGHTAPSLGNTSHTSMAKDASTSPEDASALTLQRLKDAINARLASNQQRTFSSTSPSSRPKPGSVKRIASIKEDAVLEKNPSPKLSPTLNSAFESPLQTASTESTESVKTVKGSALPTPSATALRTPSYPFPYVPGTPMKWNTAFHRPFTALSPTVSSGILRDHDPSSDELRSELSTPVASVSLFMPPGHRITEGSQDGLYPVPNLYDLVLMLNLDPGLYAWWNSVVKIFQDFFAAERLSLALPADAGELENVPWGQKATFNAAGAPGVNPKHQNYRWLELEASAPHLSYNPHPATHTKKQDSNLSARKHGFLGPRPTLSARHSYAGFESPSTHPPATPSTSGPLKMSRPGASRTKSYMPNLNTRQDMMTDTSDQFSPLPSFAHVPARHMSSISDTEFSAIPSEQQTGPFSKVLHVLRALNYETEALLEASSVNQILERGKTVILTRDYKDQLSSNNAKNAQDSGDKSDFTKKHIPAVPNSWDQYKAKKAGSTAYSFPGKLQMYEEYEQMPSSPWAQSPAPSPAVQADPEVNPFFSDTNVEEESFAPPELAVDYSNSGSVPAIGVDKASTIIHIPLIHPRQPSNFPFRATNFGMPSPFSPYETEGNTGRTSPLKKAPIAILSFAAPVVPYPQNLMNSLQYLAPHLATTFEIAMAYTNATSQKDALQHIGLIGQGTAHRSAVLEGLVDADIDIMGDTTSLTSPSDYSGRSRQSPGGSIGIATPGWEHSALSISQHGIPSTPAQEMVDSYFDAKKRGSSGSHQRGTDSPVPENDAPSKNDRKVQSEEKTNRGKAGQRPIPETRGRKGHSLLHSYGADFSSTFQTLPAAATPNLYTPHRPADTNKMQITSEATNEMPPPSERLLRTIVDSLPVQIFTAAPHTGTITWVNSKFIVYRGQETQSILKDPWHAIHTEDRPAYMEEWKRSLNTGQQFSHKVRLRRFDNAYRWFYVRATPLKDKRQKIVHWAGTFMDIHEQHIAEQHAAHQQETAASEAKYRTLANSSPQIVFVVSRTKGLTFCNSQWVLYSGQTEAEATGVGFMDFVHPDDLDKCRLPTLNEDGTIHVDAPTSLPPDKPETVRSISQQSSEDSSESTMTITSPGVDSSETSHMPQSRLSKLASSGILKLSRDRDGRPSYSTEVRLRSKDGQYRWHLVRVLLSEAINEDGVGVDTWYGTCTDINDHKALEQQLKDAMDAKSRFLSNMSHEIRTPLNGITGMVNFLIDSNLTAEQMEHANIIRNSTEGLRDLINDILDLSKVEAGMIKLSNEWFHVRSLIEEVNDIMFSLAIDKGLELSYLIDDDVPSMIKGDRFRIRQVLLNIVGNAIKFTTTGEVFVRCIEVKPETPSKDNEMLLKFEVIDTGSGFTEKEAEYLFKRFSQIDRKSQTGTGLGLAISSQLVELHGGTMTAFGEPGQGSTFSFTVRCHIPFGEERPPITAASSGGSDNLSSAVLIPTPQPINETTQGVRFPARLGEKITPMQTPSPKLFHHSSAASSGSSDPSLYTAGSSIRSQRSSVSSLMSEMVGRVPPMPLELPDRIRDSSLRVASPDLSQSSSESVATLKQQDTLSNSPRQLFQPHIFSVLVLCPLAHTLEAIIKHIELTIPNTAPHHITARQSVEECSALLTGEDAVRFSHLVIDLPDVQQILTLLDQVFESSAHANTSVVVATDLNQRREIGKQLKRDLTKLQAERRVFFIFKPLKPSKMALVFDPRKETEASTDQNQHSAQAVAVNQKMVFEELKSRLGNKGLRVLLVEDNKTSQMVLLRFLNRVSINVECVLDGAQCTEKVFAQPHSHYSLILCDLQMPVKDGYQTCKDIRHWERQNRYPHMPIIALSANVLGDVYANCVDAGFNSYVTKPVDFKELRDALVKFLDPPEKARGRNPEFMRLRS